MQKFNLKEYLKQNQKLNYVISKEEYVSGQTWCILKRQHVCLYFFVLFFAGILLELYGWAVEGRLTNGCFLSVFAVVILLITIWRAHKTAGTLYETEPHAFCLTYEKKGFLLTNTETKESVFYGWNMIWREKRIKKVGIVFLTRDIYFFLPVV